MEDVKKAKEIKKEREGLGEYEETKTECPECGSTQLVHDYERAELVCDECGLVIEEDFIDMGPEWRAFDHDQRMKRSRVGAPMTYSVDYDEPIVIENEKSGEVEIVKIGEFVDKHMIASEIDGEVEFVPIEGYNAVAFDEDYKVSFKPIQYVARHKLHEDLYELVLEGKRKVRVTGAHSVFTVHDNEVVPTTVAQLREGDFVVAPNYIPTAGSGKSAIDLLDEFSKLSDEDLYGRLYVRNIGDEVFAQLDAIQLNGGTPKRVPKDWKRRNSLPLRIASMLDGIPSDARIGIRSSPNELPIKLEITGELCKLLGYYASEGSVKGTYHNVNFSFSKDERGYIEEVQRLLRNIFGLNPSVYQKESAVQIEVPSKLLAILFADVFKLGMNAHEKRVPKFIYSLSNDMKLAFLQGYVNGDGSVYLKNENGSRPVVQVSTVSVNKDLSNDILMLYLQLGIHANYNEQEIPRHILPSGQELDQSHSTGTRITNPDSAAELGFIERVDKRRRKGALEDLIPAPQEYKHVWKHRERKRINRDLAISIAEDFNDEKLLKLATAPLVFLRITSKKNVKASSEYAYDLSVPNYENFVGGLGGIFLHNTIHDKGLSTMIDWRNRDSYGKSLSSRSRAQLYRLRKWQRRIRVSNATERNLAFALSELDRLASTLGLSRDVREAAAVVYRKAVDQNLIRGRSIEGVAAAALYAACRQCSVPRTLDEISEFSRVGRKEIGRTYRFVSRELGLKLIPTSPIDYVPRFASGLNLKGDVQSKAVEILRQAGEKELTSGRGPTGVAAAAIYIASILCGERRTQREVADVAGVTEVTIRNRYKELAEELDIDIIL